MFTSIPWFSYSILEHIWINWKNTPKFYILNRSSWEHSVPKPREVSWNRLFFAKAYIFYLRRQDPKELKRTQYQGVKTVKTTNSRSYTKIFPFSTIFLPWGFCASGPFFCPHNCPSLSAGLYWRVPSRRRQLPMPLKINTKQNTKKSYEL